MINKFIQAAVCAMIVLAGQSAAETAINSDRNTKMNNKIKMTAGGETFTVILADNATAKAFKAMLPLDLDMNELNGNEKYFRLSKALPASASNPGKVENGDIMLYGSNTIVIFYKSFSTSYGYTRIGKVEKPGTLKKAVGNGDAKIVFRQ